MISWIETCFTQRIARLTRFVKVTLPVLHPLSNWNLELKNSRIMKQVKSTTNWDLHHTQIGFCSGVSLLKIKVNCKPLRNKWVSRTCRNKLWTSWQITFYRISRVSIKKNANGLRAHTETMTFSSSSTTIVTTSSRLAIIDQSLLNSCSSLTDWLITIQYHLIIFHLLKLHNCTDLIYFYDIRVFSPNLNSFKVNIVINFFKI